MKITIKPEGYGPDNKMRYIKLICYMTDLPLLFAKGLAEKGGVICVGSAGFAQYSADEFFDKFTDAIIDIL